MLVADFFWMSYGRMITLWIWILNDNVIQMSKISNLDYAALNLSGDNYLQWALDTKINLRSKGLGDTIIEESNENDKMIHGD